MWTLDEVVALLNRHHQRATYGAVAKVINARTPRGLMKHRTGWHENSWVVAKTTNRQLGSQRGRPTGFTDRQLHPECLRQVRAGCDNIIDDADELRRWLAAVKDAG